MAEQWPASLPQDPVFPVAEPQTTNLLTGSVEIGEPKTRRVATVDVGTMEWRFIMTKAQYKTFEAWWKSTLKWATEPFDGFTDLLDRPIRVKLLKEPQVNLGAENVIEVQLSMVTIQTAAIVTASGSLGLQSSMTYTSP